MKMIFHTVTMKTKLLKTMSTLLVTDVIAKHHLNKMCVVKAQDKPKTLVSSSGEKKVQEQSLAHEKKHRKARGKAVILGDSQLYHTEENKLSSKTNKIIVRSKVGLEVNEVINTFGDILNEKADEFKFHVGVNSVEKESEEEILHKFLKLGESIDSA